MTAIGAATAIVVGCVGITPAAGFISPIWAMVLGVVAAIPSYFVIMWRPRWRVDETLDVLAAHGVAGLTGIVFIGLVAQAGWNGGLGDGAFYGDVAQLGKQLVAVLAATTYAFAATFVLLKLIGLVMPLRATASEEAIGMDIIAHGEEAYATGRRRDPRRARRQAGAWLSAGGGLGPRAHAGGCVRTAGAGACRRST